MKKYSIHLFFVLAAIAPLTIFAQPLVQLLDSMPPGFRYQVFTDSIPVWDISTGEYDHFIPGDSMALGCRSHSKFKIDFALSIGHPFLFDFSIPSTVQGRAAFQEDKILPVFAVKKADPVSDSILTDALNQYCFYGQANCVFESDRYILFTYATSINTDGMVNSLRQIGLWQQIENRLVGNLDSGAVIRASIQEASKSTLGRREVGKLLAGAYEHSSGFPGRTIKHGDGSESHLMPMTTGHTELQLKRNGKYKMKDWMNRSQSKPVKTKGFWVYDGYYIYIIRSGTRRSADIRYAQVFVVTEHGLISINGRWGYHRKNN